MAPRKIIIDTDPGVDDVLAMLLAFAALPKELEVSLLSVTYGNIDVQNCLRNVMSMFSHVEKEITWRKQQGKGLGFETLRNVKPLVAVGPSGPLADQLMMADYFHGRDGLGGIHYTHPHMTPEDTWTQPFTADANADAKKENSSMFTVSQKPAHQEILRLLEENEPDTITIVAIGPLTNVAMAAAHNPETFLRVKEVVVMGGTLALHGNVTPVAEFNTFADSVAAARLYALTSHDPASTMPPVPPAPPGQKEGEAPPPFLGAYPEKLSRQLKLTLFPLDITNRHLLTRGQFRTATAGLIAAGSPLAAWVDAFISSTFNKVESLQEDVSGDEVGLQMHDPLCIWYCMYGDDSTEWKVTKDEDIRVETSGQWTRGMCVVDQRTRKKRTDDTRGEIPGDTGNWLSKLGGNRLRRCIESPGEELFGDVLLQRIFGL